MLTQGQCSQHFEVSGRVNLLHTLCTHTCTLGAVLSNRFFQVFECVPKKTRITSKHLIEKDTPFLASDCRSSCLLRINKNISRIKPHPLFVCLRGVRLCVCACSVLACIHEQMHHCLVSVCHVSSLSLCVCWSLTSVESS